MIFIRNATLEDFNILYKMHNFINDANKSGCLGPINPAEFKIAIIDKHVIVSIDDNNEICGFCKFNILKRSPIITINTLGVLPHCRKQGIGSSMITYLIKEYKRDIRMTCVKGSDSEYFWSKIAEKYEEIPGKRRPLSRYIIKVNEGQLF